VKTSEALAYAQERDLDLVEVAPEARPPVCRALDYSKYKYEQAQKVKAARKHQQQITIREIKFRPKIAQNDYDTKKGHVTRFLLGKDKVKITIMFRGREVTHPERGTALLDRLAGELSEIAVIEQTPLQDGRNMTMMLAPSKAVLAGEVDKNGARVPTADAAPEAETDGDAAPAAEAEANADAAPAAEGGTDRDAAPAPAAEAETDGDAAPVAEAEANADAAPAAEAEANGDGPSAAQESEPAPASSDAAA